MGLGLVARATKNTKKGNFSSCSHTLGRPEGRGVRMLDRGTMFSQMPKWKLKPTKAQVTQSDHTMLGSVGVSAVVESTVAEGGSSNGRQREPGTSSSAAPDAAQRLVDHKAEHKRVIVVSECPDTPIHDEEVPRPLTKQEIVDGLGEEVLEESDDEFYGDPPTSANFYHGQYVKCSKTGNSVFKETSEQPSAARLCDVPYRCANRM